MKRLFVRILKLLNIKIREKLESVSKLGVKFLRNEGEWFFFYMVVIMKDIGWYNLIWDLKLVMFGEGSGEGVLRGYGIYREYLGFF